MTQPKKQPAAKKQVPLATRFLLGGVAGCSATCFVHPLDVTRVQMQLDAEGGGKRLYKGMGDCVTQLYKRDGIVRGLYAGLSAGILRQVAYGMPRLGIYTWLLEKVSNDQPEGVPLNFAQRLGVSAAAGGTASFMGCPAEVALVRMSADSRLPVGEKRGYTSALDAVARIASEEGVRTLWTGATPTVARAVLLNAGQLGVGSEVKARINAAGGQEKYGVLGVLIGTSVIASFAATAVSVPADTMKSRMQNMKLGPDGKPAYSSMFDCAASTVRKEGVLAMWKGFTPAFVKLTPHTVISFIVLEKLTKWYTGGDAI